MTKKISLICSALLVMLSLVGCRSSNKVEQDVTSLNILVWGSYVSEEIYDDFEKKYGIAVHPTYISNTDEILSKLLNGEGDYDVFMLESAYVSVFAENGLLTKIDWDKIPNSANIPKDKFGVIKGDKENTYTVPCDGYGYTAIVYNKEACPIEIHSFSDLADPALKGQVGMTNSTLRLFGMALTSLGYEPDTTNEEEIKEAAEVLNSIKPNIKAFFGDSGLSQMVNGECSVGLCWDYPYIMQDEKNWDKFAIAEIDSPYEKWCDYWAIPSTCTKVEAAHKLINFLLEKEEYAKSLTEYPANPMMDCSEFLPEGYMNNPAWKLDELIGKDAWFASVSDEQIDIMDKYFTNFMSK